MGLHPNRRAFLTGSAAALAAASAASLQACSQDTHAANVLPPPPVEPYELRAQYATHEMLGYRIRTRTYGGNLGGPMLETRPGQTLVVRVVNDLPPDPPAAVPAHGAMVPVYEHPSMHAMQMRLRMGPGPMTAAKHIDRMDNPHAFNTTNLHVHGIQTVPHLFEPVGTSNPSAPMIAIRPGESKTYEFPIPSDHPSGLYWYHPHHHGSTDVQVGGGMAGLLVVRGPIDDVPEIAAAREIFLTIQSLELNPAPHDPHLLQFEFVPYQTPYPQGPGYNCAFDYMIVMVNQQPVSFVNYVYRDRKAKRREASVKFTQHPPPQYEMQPGEVVRLRILQGTNFMFMPLALDGMDAYVIERDGINLPKPHLLNQRRRLERVDRKNVYAGTSVDMPPGSRAELLIQAKEPGEYVLRSVAIADLADMDYPDIELARFVVKGAPKPMSIPSSLPKVSREEPPISPQHIVQTRGLEFSEEPSTKILPGVAYLLNGESYDEFKVDWMLRVGTAEEWSLTNVSDEGHPFHVHTNSFEVIAADGSSIPRTIRDVIWIPPAKGLSPGSVTIRIRFKQWRGKDVFHCHILPHEDLGMMQNVMLQ